MLHAGIGTTVVGRNNARPAAVSHSQQAAVHKLRILQPCQWALRSNRHVARMFPRDAEFATAQLQGIIAELRADPALSLLLDDPKVAAAIKDIATNPAALQKHASNPKVMRVMERLLGQDLAANEAAMFAKAGTSPTQVLTALSSDAELAQLLKHPTVRKGLAQIRANPDAGLARWGSEPLVSRALDLLEQVLGDGAGSLGQVVDVVAEEVKQKQQGQDGQQQQQQKDRTQQNVNGTVVNIG